MAIKVTQKIKEAFIAMPHVEEVWVTPDGNYHLHDANGGRNVKRGDVDLDSELAAKPAAISPADKEIIAEIDKSTTAEELDKFDALGASEVVVEAIKEKKEAIATGIVKKDKGGNQSKK